MASKEIKKRNKDSANIFKLAKGLKAKKMSIGGPITTRDINKNGKKDGFEVARAKGMAKGMGKKFKAKKGGRA